MVHSESADAEEQSEAPATQYGLGLHRGQGDSRAPLILVTNDDGIHSPGLHAVIKAVCDLGEVIVTAPRQQHTGASRSYPPVRDKAVYREEIPVNCHTVVAYGVEASPAQAVLLALLDLLPRPPDLLISGINFGENLGTEVTLSGTVGAAIEAASFDVPGLAVSLETAKEFHYRHSDAVDFTVAAGFARRFAEMVLAGGLPPDADILKIDVPCDATLDTPWRVTRVSRRRYYVPKPSGRRRLDEQKGIGYAVEVDLHGLEPDSDIYAMAVDRVVSVCPLSIDLTARVDFGALSADLRQRQPYVSS